MYKIFALMISILVFSGCATVANKDDSSRILSEKDQNEMASSSNVYDAETSVDNVSPVTNLENVQDVKLQQYVEKKGVVFGKAIFEGLLKTSYVKLTCENLANPANKFNLTLGSNKSQDPGSIWEVKTVDPQYFFIELSEGEYKIASISIPVGTTLATEMVDVRFEVLPRKISYLGTLKINGTKERIKFGVVPVMRPGFEYDVEVLDQNQEGVEEFKKRYSNVNTDINIGLMKVNQEQKI